MNLDALAGLDSGQRILLYGRCAELLGEVVRPGGRPAAIGLYQLVMLVGPPDAQDPHGPVRTPTSTHPSSTPVSPLTSLNHQGSGVTLWSTQKTL